jgi:hypothetical protein
MPVPLPATVGSVAELPDLPFQSFAEFQEAVRAEQAFVWVRYDFHVMWVLSDPGERVLHLLLEGSAGWYSLCLIVWAVASHNYWLLLGIPGALLGYLFASANANMVYGCVPCILALIGFVAVFVSGWQYFFTWAAACATWFLTCAGLGTASLQVRNAMVHSEELLLWLCERKTITNVLRREPDRIESDPTA